MSTFFNLLVFFPYLPLFGALIHNLHQRGRIQHLTAARSAQEQRIVEMSERHNTRVQELLKCCNMARTDGDRPEKEVEDLLRIIHSVCFMYPSGTAQRLIRMVSDYYGSTDRISRRNTDRATITNSLRSDARAWITRYESANPSKRRAPSRTVQQQPCFKGVRTSGILSNLR